MLAEAAAPLADATVLQVLWLVACVVGSAPFFYRVALDWRQISAPWRLISAGFAIRLLSDGIWTVEYLAAGGVTPFPSYNDIGFLASYALFLAGVALADRQGTDRGSRVRLDALIVTCALAIVHWVLLFHPYLHRIGLSGLALVLAVAYPLFDLVLFGGAVTQLFSARTRNQPTRLVLFAICATLAANTIYFASAAASDFRTVTISDSALWLVSYVLIGVAGLQRATLGAAEPSTRNRAPLSGRRTIAFAVATLIGPASLLVMTGTSQFGQWNSTEWGHLIVPAALSGALSMLLVIRLSFVARVAQQRSEELDRRTIELDRQARDLAEALEERKALERQLRHHALHDPVTGLANRALLSQRMEWALSRRDNTGQHALLLLDLDWFNNVNDSLGHAKGDELLVELAHRLRAAVTPADTLARLGGDEFAVFVEDIASFQARELADHLREVIRAPLRLDGRDVYLTASIGLVDIHDARITPQDALRDADLALYAAKRNGRDRVVVFSPELRTARETFTRIADGLRKALAHDGLAVHYQPVVDLSTGQIMAVEALVRWTLAGSDPVSPAEFIPVAEETGLIVPLGAWVLRRACQDTRPWHARYGISVTVNVSGHQLVEPDFADTVLRTLSEVDLPATALILEITETVLIAGGDQSERTLDTLNRLRDEGVRIAIDDFGTGYSSLSYLTQLPVDLLKIDRSFVPSAGEASSDDHAFTRAVLQLGASRRLPAIAEGVETPEQARLLREMGCTLAQGYLFARPSPAVVIDAALARFNTPITKPSDDSAVVTGVRS